METGFVNTNEAGKAPKKKSGLLENNTRSLKVFRTGKLHLEKNDHAFPFFIFSHRHSSHPMAISELEYLARTDLWSDSVCS